MVYTQSPDWLNAVSNNHTAKELLKLLQPVPENQFYLLFKQYLLNILTGSTHRKRAS